MKTCVPLINHGEGTIGGVLTPITGYNMWTNCIIVCSLKIIHMEADMVYLARKNGTVIFHTDLAAMKRLDGINKAEKSITDAEWNEAGGVKIYLPVCLVLVHQRRRCPGITDCKV